VLTIPAPRRYAWVSGAAFLLGGAMILTTTVLVPLRAVGRARYWRPASGLLQNIHVVCRRVFCYPHAEYVYRVPDPHVTQQGIRDTGRVYNGTAITFVDPALHSEADQILILGRYHPGGSVQVFYDPRRPWKAVLERRVPVSQETWWVGGLLCGGGGLILILGLPYNRAVISRWRRWREARNRAA